MIISISGKISSGKDTVARIIQYYLSNPNTTYDNWHNELGLMSPEEASGWELYRFADEIKDTVCRWIGCTREQLEDREFKEKPLGKEWHVWYIEHQNDRKIFKSEQRREEYLSWLSEVNYDRYEDTAYGDYRLTPRKLLQLLGTEAGREIIHPDIWVNALFSDYTPDFIQQLEDGEHKVYPNWIIPDTRFPNELKRINKYNGVTIRVERFLTLRYPEIWQEYGYSKSVEPSTENDKLLLGYMKREYSELYRKLTHASETSLDNYEDWDYVIYNNYSIEKLIISVKDIVQTEELL